MRELHFRFWWDDLENPEESECEDNSVQDQGDGERTSAKPAPVGRLRCRESMGKGFDVRLLHGMACLLPKGETWLLSFSWGNSHEVHELISAVPGEGSDGGAAGEGVTVRSRILRSSDSDSRKFPFNDAICRNSAFIWI